MTTWLSQGTVGHSVLAPLYDQCPSLSDPIEHVITTKDVAHLIRCRGGDELPGTEQFSRIQKPGCLQTILFSTGPVRPGEVALPAQPFYGCGAKGGPALEKQDISVVCNRWVELAKRWNRFVPLKPVDPTL